MHTHFLLQYLIHELARTFRPVLRVCEIHTNYLEREEWFAVRGLVRLKCGVVPLCFFDVPFQPRFLLREFIIRSSRLDDCAGESSNWLQEAGWLALRTTARCENVILPIGSYWGRLESLGETSRSQTLAVIRAARPPSGVWTTGRNAMSCRPTRCGQPRRGAWASRRMAQALKIVMDQGCENVVPVRDPFRNALVVVPGGEGPEDHAENESLQGLPPLSSSSLEACTRASTPRDHACHGLWGGPYWRGITPWPGAARFSLAPAPRQWELESDGRIASHRASFKGNGQVRMAKVRATRTGVTAAT